MKPRSPLPLVMMLAAATLASAQAPDSWVGKRVFTKYGAVLQVANKVVDDAGRSQNLASSGKDRIVHRTYRVERVNGDWLWLKDENSSVAGWVQSKWVIPFEQAVDYYTNEILENPTSNNYVARAKIWKEKGEYDIAIGDLNDAIQIDPSNELAYLVRGNVWSLKKDYDRAIADYGEAMRRDPRFALTYINRGNAWIAKQDYERAIADYGEVIRLDPKFAAAYYSRGNAWIYKQDYDRAIADFDEAIRLDPKFAEAYIGRGNVWGNKKDYIRAITEFDQAIRIDPKNASAYYKRGLSWKNKKDYDRALVEYNEATRLDPKNHDYFNGRAWLWATCPDAKFRDGKKAVESATKACELTAWKDGNDLDTLAASYAEAGDFGQAVKWEEKAIALTPESEAEVKKALNERLALYRDGKPYREP